MHVHEYENAAKRTLNPDLSKEESCTNTILGLCSETGEIAGHFKKAMYHGHTFDREHILKELGDLQWYIVQMCYALDTELDVIMYMNVEKLNQRYGNGFSYEASKNRDK